MPILSAKFPLFPFICAKNLVNYSQRGKEELRFRVILILAQMYLRLRVLQTNSQRLSATG